MKKFFGLLLAFMAGGVLSIVLYKWLESQPLPQMSNWLSSTSSSSSSSNMSVTTTNGRKTVVMGGNVMLVPESAAAGGTESYVVNVVEGASIVLNGALLTGEDYALLKRNIEDGTLMCFRGVQRADHDNVHTAESIAQSCN